VETRDILNRITQVLGEKELSWVHDHLGDPYLVVPSEKARRLAIILKGDRHLGFDTLMSLTCVHQLGEPEELVLVYHLFSMLHRHRLTVKVKLERPVLFPHFYLRTDTVSDIWPAAGWLEREVYDMFGVRFVGHRDFRRLLLPPDWQGHPLVKDYREPDVYQGISTTREDVFQEETASGPSSEPAATLDPANAT
jgi:NADH-quinone oxidoreductase subunit C